MEIIKESAFEAWLTAIKLIRENGSDITDHDNRLSRELLNLVITIKHPGADIIKPIQVMRDLKKWVYPELEELEAVFFKKEASSFYDYTYGARIFNYANRKNQVDDFVIPLLKRDPSTRRAVVVLYSPDSDSRLSTKEVPGLVNIFFKIINNKLTLTTIIRSNDIFIGWPANIYQIYLLQKYVAEKLNLEPGSITTVSHSAHIFLEYEEEIEAVLNKK